MVLTLIKRSHIHHLKSDGHKNPDLRRSADHGRNLRRGIFPLLLLTTIFFLNFNARVIIAPLMPEIEAELRISHGSAGSMFFMISAGYFIALIGSGWVAARFNHRKTILLSTSVLGLAIAFTAFTNGVEAIRVTMFVVGLAAGVYLPSGIATLTNLIEPGQWGRAIAIHEMAPNLSFILAPLLCELMLLWFSWRAVFLLLGTITLLFSVVYACHGRGGSFYATAPGFDSFKRFLSEPAFWIMVLLFGLGISSSLGVYTMLPLYLVTDHAIDRSLANSVIALSRISGLFMAFAGGWVVDRFGPRVTMTAVFLVTGATTIIMGLGSGPMVLAAVFLQPMAAVCFFPAGFAALARIGPPDARNIGVSLAVPLGFVLGGGAVPVLIGTMGDSFSFATGILIVGCCITAGALPAWSLKFRGTAR